MKAYHLSPNLFSEFDLKHVAEGFSTALKGYGLYFTLDKNVVDYYRAQLEDVDGDDFQWYLYTVDIDMVDASNARIVNEWDPEGWELYGNLVKELGSEKEASKAMVEECGVNGIKYYDEEDGNSILVFNPEIVHILKTQPVDAYGKLLIENKSFNINRKDKRELNKVTKENSKGKDRNMNYSESRREHAILRGFKKGYDALVDALETQSPTSWGFVTNCRFRIGSDDFNGDYIIEMSFDTIDANNIRYYIDGDVKRVKMTTYFNHEKAIANLINETVDFDDVYVMEGPRGETSLYITNATPANERLSTGKSFNEDSSRLSKRLKESESNLYYFGICCYEKKDTKHDYPCFLAIGKDGDFTPVGWSFWEILAGSKFVKGESESDPTYGSKTAKMMTLNDLWVECHTSDPSKNPDFDPSNFLMRLEKVFPDFDFYATVYPKSKMDAYYDYSDGPSTEDLPAEVEAAYMRLNDKLQNVELKEKSSWSFPF